MAFRASALSRSWRNTHRTRGSLAWWIAAVIMGATLAVAACYIAPGDSSLFFAFAGVVIGFFAPYALALVWNLLGAYGRQPETSLKRDPRYK
jgi:hypothetical protein